MSEITPTVRFGKELERIRERSKAKHPRLDEALEGAMFILERNPSLGRSLGDRWVLGLDTGPGVHLTIFYGFDESAVTLDSIIEIEE